MSRFDVKSFCSPPDPEFICGICMNVLDEPKETPCRHVFCKVCITAALETKRRCPMCRSRCKIHELRPVLPLVQNLMNKLQMQCKYHRGGEAGRSCKQIIKKEFYLDHIKKCDFAYVECPHVECKSLVMRKDRHIHKKTCKYRLVTCHKGCNTQYKWKDRASHNCVEALKDELKVLKARNKMLQKLVDELYSEDQPSTASGAATRTHNSDRAFNSAWSSLNPSNVSPVNRGLSSQGGTTPSHSAPTLYITENSPEPAHMEAEFVSSTTTAASRRARIIAFLGRGRGSAVGLLGFGSRSGSETNISAPAGDGVHQNTTNRYDSYGPPVVDMNEEDLYANYSLGDTNATGNGNNGQAPAENGTGTAPIINISSSAVDSPDDQDGQYYEPAGEETFEEFEGDGEHHYQEGYASYGDDVSDSYPRRWTDEEEEEEEDDYLPALEGEESENEGVDNPDDSGDSIIVSNSHGGNEDQRYDGEDQPHYAGSPVRANSSDADDHREAESSGQGAASGQSVSEWPIAGGSGFGWSSPSEDLGRGHGAWSWSDNWHEDGPPSTKRPRFEGGTTDSPRASGSGSAGMGEGTSDNDGVEPTTTTSPPENSADAEEGDRRRSARLQGLVPSPSAIPNVAVPLSTAELLERYAGSEDESDDPSWDSDDCC